MEHKSTDPWCQSNILFQTFIREETKDLSASQQGLVITRYLNFITRILLPFKQVLNHEKPTLATLQMLLHRLKGLLVDVGYEYDETTSNPLAVFFKTGPTFRCNCACSTYFLLACLECLGWLSSSYFQVHLASEAEHIYILLTNSSGTQRLVCETTCNPTETCSMVQNYGVTTSDEQPFVLTDPLDIAACYIIEKYTNTSTYHNQIDLAVSGLENLWGTFGFSTHMDLIWKLLPLRNQTLSEVIQELSPGLILNSSYENLIYYRRLWGYVDEHIIEAPEPLQDLVLNTLVTLWGRQLAQQKAQWAQVRTLSDMKPKYELVHVIEQILESLLDWHTPANVNEEEEDYDESDDDSIPLPPPSPPRPDWV